MEPWRFQKHLTQLQGQPGATVRYAPLSAAQPCSSEYIETIAKDRIWIMTREHIESRAESFMIALQAYCLHSTDSGDDAPRACSMCSIQS